MCWDVTAHFTKYLKHFKKDREYMKKIKLTGQGDKESYKKLVKQLKKASKDREVCEIFEILKEDGEDIALEALLIPNSDEFVDVFTYLEDQGADSVEYNLKDSELKAQMGLSLMTVSMSMGERKILFLDKKGNVHFAMTTRSIYDQIMKN